MSRFIKILKQRFSTVSLLMVTELLIMEPGQRGPTEHPNPALASQDHSGERVKRWRLEEFWILPQSHRREDHWDTEWTLTDIGQAFSGVMKRKCRHHLLGVCKRDGRDSGFWNSSLFLQSFTGRSILFISELARNSWGRTIFTLGSPWQDHVYKGNAGLGQVWAGAQIAKDSSGKWCKSADAVGWQWKIQVLQSILRIVRVAKNFGFWDRALARQYCLPRECASVRVHVLV